MFILLTIVMMVAMAISAIFMIIEESKKREAPLKTSRFGVYQTGDN